MKIRPFLAAILAVAVTLLLIGAAGWVVIWRSSPLALQHQPLTLPLAARFIPRQASLSLHLLIPPDQLGAYARAVAPPRQRRRAAAALEQLRDGAFAAAGLDYTEELASWVGEESSFALLTPPGAAQPAGWLLALRSRESEGARRFLQRFWQTRSLAGNELQVSTYRGMGLISGRGALLGQNALPLATALIDDRLVLIASGRGVLEQALDVSQIDELNQAGDPRLVTAVAALGQGVALVAARPDSFTPWLGASPALAAQREVLGLVAALAPRGRTLDLNARLELRHAPPALVLESTPDLLAGLQGPSDSLALIQNPALLTAAPPGRAATTVPDDVPEDVPDLWSELVAPALAPTVATLPGVLPALVIAQDPGPLLWSHSSRGWLLATAPDTPAIAPLSDVVARDGLIAAPLRRNGKTLQLWTRLTAGSSRSHPDQLDAAIAGARLDQRGVAWWSEGITALSGLLEEAAPPSERLAQLQGLEDRAAPLQWGMAAAPARSLLARWDPWQLLTGLAGESLAPSVQGLALSLEEDSATAPAAPALRLHGRLELG
ncbi:DUF3352 domain-containing protein [Synechococcus sp. ATX 2A4]|uniref:DUF3352 domain-containing protein n=1 Tax=Synechococcus sp. ATX 2A4 TaxID=2823727 RepID=UPI0020CF2D84|nr:DUF3352 domain-containing protein [Synechococcus sp. ATX 2A4]MCP9884795.1 DUF3352 domain-containing protein [Synechococcus sp. ATX 2A4]